MGDFSDAIVKAIGVLGSLGLILPSVLGIAPVLTPLAAVGIALVMVGAAITHAQRGESQATVIDGVLLAVATFVAWARFGPYAL